MPNALPVISTLPGMEQYRQVLNEALKSPAVPKVPWNFTVVSRQGGNYLTWQQVAGADGYIVSVSLNGDFSTKITAVPLMGAQNTAYFDTVPTSGGAAPAKRYYKVNATSGTATLPQSVQGIATGVVSSTAIAPNDTTTAPTSKSDTTTTDSRQSNTRTGSYRNPLPKF